MFGYLKRGVHKVVSVLGYSLVKKNHLIVRTNTIDASVNSRVNTMTASLQRLKGMFKPDYILDLGAAKGKWTEKAMCYWPEAHYILVEPISEQIKIIPDLIKNTSEVEIIEAVAGHTTGQEILTITDDPDGSGLYGGIGKNKRKVPVVTVDNFMTQKNGSVFLKLDTHGYEIQIFEGAKQTLKRTEAIIVEVYGFHVSPTGKLFHEISGYLEEKGFRLFDIVDVMRRPKDKAFWQADAIYISKRHSVFNSNDYK